MLKETLSQTDLVELPMFTFILFMVVFTFVVVRVLVRGRHDQQYVALAALPLNDDAGVETEVRR